MSNTNLDDFFSSGNINVISDYEGEQINSKLYNKTNKLIVCGDILDSTVGRGSENLLDKKTGTINNIQKIYNLRNILAVVENPNIHLIFGNRDINKFKCKFLTKMVTYGHLDIFDKFNKGDIHLDKSTYKQYKMNPPKWKADTRNWYPFWSDKISENLEYWRTPETDIKETNIFLKRFFRIFGTDGIQGTMSALNLLYTIPVELGINIDYELLDPIPDNNKLDYLAFIVLAVFRIMTLINNTPQEIKTQNIENIGTMNELKYTVLNGLLSRLYSGLPNTSYVSYFNDKINKRLYIFSHGGITSTLIKGENYSELIKIIEQKYDVLTNMSGGTLELTSSDIIKNLEQINVDYIEILKETFKKPKKYDYIPTRGMLLALAISAPYKPDNTDIFILNSPITPGIDIIEKYLFYCSDSNIVQIFGHVPKGFGTTISKHVSGNNKTYLINLDISQSYKYTQYGGKTYSLLIFQSGNMKNGPILNCIIDIEKIKYLVMPKDITDIKDIPSYYSNKRLSSNILQTNLKQYMFEPRFIDDYEAYIPTGFHDYKYHGLYKDSKSSNEFYVFSIFNGYNKQLILKKVGKEISVNLKRTRTDTTSSKQKYYKYKLKYLKLKMSLNNQI